MPGIAVCNSPILACGSPPPWTPAAVPGCILYGGGYREDRAVRAASPTIPGAGWTGANWAGSGLGPYQHTAGATADLTQAILLAGNRYTTAFAVSGLTAGTVTHKQGTAAGAVRSSDGSYIDELTAQATSALWTPSNDFDGAVLVNSIVNLSLSSYSPAYTTVAGSVLAQATPTAQPWVSSDGLGIRYQGGDLLQWSAAASNVKCLHDGTGGTLILALRMKTVNARNFIFTTMPMGSSTDTGIALEWRNDGNFHFNVGNGGVGGAWALYKIFNVAVAADTTYVITVRVAAGANATSVRVNGAVATTGTLASPSVSDPLLPLYIGSLSAGSALSVDGIIGHPFVANRVLTDAECTQVEQYILAQATL